MTERKSAFGPFETLQDVPGATLWALWAEAGIAGAKTFAEECAREMDRREKRQKRR